MNGLPTRPRRARLLLQLLTAASAALVLFLTPARGLAEESGLGPAVVESATIENISEDFLAFVNTERAAYGLPPLSEWREAHDTAVARGYDMAAAGRLTHRGPSALGVEDWLRARGWFSGLVGENIARTNVEESWVTSVIWQSWMASPGHRENILDPRFTMAGIGVVNVGGWYYVSVVFLGDPVIGWHESGV